MRIHLRSLGLLVAIFYLTTSFASADEIRIGATVQVKPNSIWFEDAAKLTQWQKLKRSGNSAAVTSYESEALSRREAWRFTKPLTAVILSYEYKSNRINVQMKTDGRLEGSIWFLDTEAIER